MDYQQQQQQQQYQQQQQMQPNPYEGQPQQQPIQQEYAQGAAVQNQEWQASLCSCSPIDSCCLAYWLPCILLGKTSERIRDPTMQTYEAINTDCLLYGAIQCFTGCGWIYALMKRGEIRERFGIKGSGASDCCVSYWCCCCALIQQDNEVKARLSTGPIVQGYQPQKEGMHMPPPQPHN
ncbi:Protein PLANT CADMIUM RESISTANCE 2 [Colletotrichum siamense]|uniref:Protein PLANT CADMIUM RESISTANCE 2 n=1 Tax=Colletotrichum siamense TaxID=690259 RepID=A0A9P5K9S3_COLSI|nr:Protein PLANT CADMIUM RESISTANCE 2 [Colletotrichum siamense]KAF4865194.1 Protein PLANT CADMIUM RESISTANCE 2 [Colletotrichum siamense]